MLLPCSTVNITMIAWRHAKSWFFMAIATILSGIGFWATQSWRSWSEWRESFLWRHGRWSSPTQKQLFFLPTVIRASRLSGSWRSTYQSAGRTYSLVRPQARETIPAARGLLVVAAVAWVKRSNNVLWMSLRLGLSTRLLPLPLVKRVLILVRLILSFAMTHLRVLFACYSAWAVQAVNVQAKSTCFLLTMRRKNLINPLTITNISSGWFRTTQRLINLSSACGTVCSHRMCGQNVWKWQLTFRRKIKNCWQWTILCARRRTRSVSDSRRTRDGHLSVQPRNSTCPTELRPGLWARARGNAWVVLCLLLLPRSQSAPKELVAVKVKKQPSMHFLMMQQLMTTVTRTLTMRKNLGSAYYLLLSMIKRRILEVQMRIRSDYHQRIPSRTLIHGPSRAGCQWIQLSWLKTRYNTSLPKRPHQESPLMVPSRPSCHHAR